MRKIMMAASLAAATAMTVAPATAQVSGAGGLIAVNIPVTDVNILNNFLNDTQIAALNNLTVPITVQAPISVAAAVCNIPVSVLASQKNKGGGDCTATSGSGALASLVSKQLLDQKMKKNQ